MNFLKEIIEISSSNESIDTRKNLTRLTGEVKRYQSEVENYIDSNYMDFLPNLHTNGLFLEEGEKLIREVEDIIQDIENDTKHDLYSASEDLRQSVNELQEVSLGLRTSYKILKIDELFQSVDTAKTNNEYLKVMDDISKIKCLIEDPSDKILHRLDCFQNIKIKYHIEAEMLLHNLKQNFDELVQLIEKPFQNTKSVTLRISKDTEKLRNIIIALFNARFNPKKICDFLIENVFTPIMMKPVSKELSENDSDYIQLTLSFSIKNLDESLRPNYKDVFNHIKEIMNLLERLNIQISDSLCVSKVLGDQMKERFLKLLITECLMYSIPDTMNEMGNSTLVEDILEFNDYLVEYYLIDKNHDHDLTEYAKKIRILFKNRFCTNILDKAVEIMHKDLHNMTIVEKKFSSNDETRMDEEYTFPRCMISKSTLELTNLMENLLEESKTADDDIKERLISTVPAILRKYSAEVPTFHEKFLQNIPQHTALFHNNCMYLAHWLTSNANVSIESFATVTRALQDLGSKHFLNQIKNQRSQLMDILQELELNDAISELGTGAPKIIRQCLRQLELLKNVWQTVLPDMVYNKTMGNLLSDFCTEMIKKVLSMEDIPTTIGNDLTDLCQIIIDRAPTLFQDENHVLQVENWMKLIQLKMILAASMVEIAEQWSEGKGPLTLNYKAQEVKHLIRALFQNTDRRAKILASIV